MAFLKNTKPGIDAIDYLNYYSMKSEIWDCQILQNSILIN